MAIIKVYSTPTCPWCVKAKDFLKQNKIKFVDFDVSEDAKARNELIEKSGQLGVPVLDINDNIVIGFDVERIKQLLKIK